MKQVFYAIDMGAPSGKYSGFYCWRYNPESKILDAFDKTSGWYKSIESIKNDSKDYQVHLTIEAALWGMRDRKSRDWVRRFNLVRESDWSERPWYTGAGASTGLMAQLFLNQIAITKPKKIIVRESYISGLSFEGCSLTVQKPSTSIINFKTKHACDAFEGLLLTLEDQEVGADLQKLEFNFNGQNLRIDEWINLSQKEFHEIKIRDNENFALGILNNSDLFDFKLGKILFTKRNFGNFPRKLA